MSGLKLIKINASPNGIAHTEREKNDKLMKNVNLSLDERQLAVLK